MLTCLGSQSISNLVFPSSPSIESTCKENKYYIHIVNRKIQKKMEPVRNRAQFPSPQPFQMESSFLLCSHCLLEQLPVITYLFDAARLCKEAHEYDSSRLSYLGIEPCKYSRRVCSKTESSNLKLIIHIITICRKSATISFSNTLFIYFWIVLAMPDLLGASVSRMKKDPDGPMISNRNGCSGLS